MAKSIAEEPQRTKFHTHPDVVFQRMGDEVLLLHLGTNRFYELNGSAVSIWELLDARLNREEVIARIREEYHVNAETAIENVDQFTRMLKKEHLIRVVDHGSEAGGTSEGGVS